LYVKEEKENRKKKGSKEGSEETRLERCGTTC